MRKTFFLSPLPRSASTHTHGFPGPPTPVCGFTTSFGKSVRSSQAFGRELWCSCLVLSCLVLVLSCPVLSCLVYVFVFVMLSRWSGQTWNYIFSHNYQRPVHPAMQAQRYIECMRGVSLDHFASWDIAFHEPRPLYMWHSSEPCPHRNSPRYLNSNVHSERYIYVLTLTTVPWATS